jgi:NAD(P)-dependent dehydrogenase (short-subunit alcohol dehydrogenase family)
VTSSPDAIGMLSGKVAVITGAGRGIGRVTAESFVREGAKVLVADITGQQDEVAASLGAAAVACKVDIRDEGQVEAVFARALEAFGRVDCSIHVAGNPGARRGPEITEQEFTDLTDVHLRGTTFCCKHAVRAMVPTGGGSIVNFSSVGSLNADPLVSIVYGAAKAGINSLTKGFAAQFGPQGVRVNAVLPGFTLSEKNQGLPPEIAERLNNKAALARAGRPDEVAQAVTFLASDRASFISGVILPVDGAWSARLA